MPSAFPGASIPDGRVFCALFDARTYSGAWGLVQSLHMYGLRHTPIRDTP